MEGIRVLLDAAEYDRITHGGPPEAGDLVIAVKPKCTVGGKAGVVIGFTIELDGKKIPVQATTTAALLATVGRMLQGWKEGGHIDF